MTQFCLYIEHDSLPRNHPSLQLCVTAGDVPAVKEREGLWHVCSRGQPHLVPPQTFPSVIIPDVVLAPASQLPIYPTRAPVRPNPRTFIMISIETE